MTQRKRLDGELASWHPHPKEAPPSLAPLVRDASPADDLADRFFDSAPALYVPEPSVALDVAPKRTALDAAKVQARRRYLMRYVAGAVGLASLIGLAAVVRATTSREASASEGFIETHAATLAFADPLGTSATTDPAPSPQAPADLAPPAQAPTDRAQPASTPAPAPADEAHAVVAVDPVAASEPARATDPAVEREHAAEPNDETVEEAPAAHAAVPAARTDARSAGEAKRMSLRALDHGRLTAAIEAGLQSVALDPTDADAWLILGAAYQKEGRDSQARKCFTRCSKRAKRGARGECRALLR
jgi:tetratricopeptide (TPR) repeat protein